MIIGIVGWIVVGLLVGFIAGKFLDLHGDDPRLGPIVACLSGIVAAVFYTIVSGARVTPWNLWSLLFAVIGALVGVVIWHAIRSRFVSRASFTRRSSY